MPRSESILVSGELRAADRLCAAPDQKIPNEPIFNRNSNISNYLHDLKTDPIPGLDPLVPPSQPALEQTGACRSGPWTSQFPLFTSEL